MADIGTTSTALAMTLAGLVYPNGLTGSSISGRRTIIRRGWLLLSDLAGACSLSKGIDYVTVMPMGSSYKRVDSPLDYPWRTVSISGCTVGLSVSGNVLTVSIPDGVTPTGIVGAQILFQDGSSTPNATSVSHAVTADDTADMIAMSLAQQVEEAYPRGATVIVPNAREIIARTGGIGTQRRITRRQETLFRVSLWSGSWKGRDALGSALEAAASAEWFIPNTDGTFSQIKFAGAQDVDTQQTSSIYRRDLLWKVTYDTIQTQTAPQMLWGVGNNNVVTHAGLALHSFGSVLPTTGVLTDNFETVYLDAAGNLVLLAQQPYSGLALDAAGNVIEDAGGNLAAFPQ